MKTKLLLCFLFCSCIGQAQDFWTETEPFPGQAQYYANSISVADENTVWITATDIDADGSGSGTEKWALSTDGGVTWTNGNLPVQDGSVRICNITAVSATTAYVARYPNWSGVQSGIWATFDAGATWTKLQPSIYFGADAFLDDVHFFDANNGVAIGDPNSGYFEIYMTSNGGTNWTRTPSTNIPPPLLGEYAIIGQYAAADGAIWFGTNKGRIFRSLDKGLVWVAFDRPFQQDNVYDPTPPINFAFRDANNGIQVLRNGDFYRTDNGGQTWNLESSGTFWNRSIFNVPQTSGTYFRLGFDATETDMGSSYTTNGGNDWTDLNLIDNPFWPITARFHSSTVGYCCAYYADGSNSHPDFFRLTDPLNRLLKTTTFKAKGQFAAVPTPTRGLVKLSGENITFVQVSDISGKVVLTQNFNALDEITVDITPFQNGIYTATVSTQNGISNAVKIVKN